MRPSYELMRTFLTAAEAGTFARAAALDGVSVSAISQKVRALEEQLGVALFERVGRRVRLLPAGRTLMLTLKSRFAQIDDAVKTVQEDFQSVRGSVAVGSPRAFGAHWLRPRLVSLLTRHPELQMDIQFDVPSVLERDLSEGALDLAILVRPALLAGIRTVPIARETFVAVASKKYLKRWGRPSHVGEFLTQRYGVFDRDLPMHAAWWRASFGAKAPLPTNITCRVASLDELLAIAESDVALVVLPDYFVDRSVREGRVEVVEPSPGQHARQRRAGNSLFLAWREGTPPTARFLAVRRALET